MTYPNYAPYGQPPPEASQPEPHAEASGSHVAEPTTGTSLAEAPGAVLVPSQREPVDEERADSDAAPAYRPAEDHVVAEVPAAEGSRAEEEDLTVVPETEGTAEGTLYQSEATRSAAEPADAEPEDAGHTDVADVPNHTDVADVPNHTDVTRDPDAPAAWPIDADHPGAALPADPDGYSPSAVRTEESDGEVLADAPETEADRASGEDTFGEDRLGGVGFGDDEVGGDAGDETTPAQAVAAEPPESAGAPEATDAAEPAVATEPVAAEPAVATEPVAAEPAVATEPVLAEPDAAAPDLAAEPATAEEPAGVDVPPSGAEAPAGATATTPDDEPGDRPDNAPEAGSTDRSDDGSDDGSDVAAWSPEAVVAQSDPARPGEVAESRIAVWAAADTTVFRDRLSGATAQFVDDPGGAVSTAAAVVGDAVEALAATLQRQHVELDPRRVAENPDTEALRMAIRAYRDFLERVLAL